MNGIQEHRRNQFYVHLAKVSIGIQLDRRIAMLEPKTRVWVDGEDCFTDLRKRCFVCGSRRSKYVETFVESKNMSYFYCMHVTCVSIAMDKIADECTDKHVLCRLLTYKKERDVR